MNKEQIEKLKEMIWTLAYENNAEELYADTIRYLRSIATPPAPSKSELPSDDVFSETKQVVKGAMKAVEHLVRKPNIPKSLPQSEGQRYGKAILLLRQLYESCNPVEVIPHKKAWGIDLGEFYVGGCGIPSDDVIHKVNDFLSAQEPKGSEGEQCVWCKKNTMQKTMAICKECFDKYPM